MNHNPSRSGIERSRSFDNQQREEATQSEKKARNSLVRVRIPLPLRQHTEGKGIIEVAGDTVQAVLEDLSRRFPGITPMLVSEGRVNIFLNNEHVRFLTERTAAVVKDGDEVTIVPVITGADCREEEIIKG
jgi:molybdopterin converting factor small subunit